MLHPSPDSPKSRSSTLSATKTRGPSYIHINLSSWKFKVVEKAFRCLKTVDLKVRPIHHYRDRRIVAHIFLCMLAYYV